MRSVLVVMWCLGWCLEVAAQSPLELLNPWPLLARAQAELEVAPSVEDGVPVTVRTADGRPCAELDLIVLPAGGWIAMPRAERVELLAKVGKDPLDRQVALIQRLGARYVTDEAGVVRVAVDEVLTVMALHPAAIKTDVLRPGMTRLDLVLTIEDRIGVKVVDWTGRPAASQPVQLGSGRGAAYVTAVTDATGHAFLVVPEETVDRSGLVVSAPGVHLHPGSQAQRSRAVVGNHQPGDPPLKLQLPPVGTVRFILYGVDERPLDHLEGAQLSIVGVSSRSYRSPSQIEPDNAVFEDIPLGCDIVVSATVRNLAGNLEIKAKGPTHPGELVIVDGRLGSGPSILKGRLLDGDGNPIEGKFGVAFVARDRFQDSSGEALADGSFQLLLPDDVDGNAWQGLTLYFDHRAADGDYGGMAAIGLRDLIQMPTLPDGSKPSRSRDLGDIQLAEPPVLVSGVVVDTDGQPLPGMTVSAPTTLISRGGGWRQSGFFQHEVTTDELGQFTLREFEPRHAPVKLSVSGATHGSEAAIEANIGQRDVRIEARQYGRIVAELAGRPFDGAGLTAKLHRRGAPGSVVILYFADGKADHSRVPHGTYDLELAASHRGDTLTIKGIEVPPAGVAQDARLQPIDWTTTFRLVRVKVRDEGGRPIANTGLIWRYISDGRGGRSGHGRHTNNKGEVAFFCPFQRTTIDAKVDGYIEQSVAADKEEIVFTLKPAPRIDVRLPADLKLPAGLKVVVKLGTDRFVGHASHEPGQTVSLFPTKEGAQVITFGLARHHQETNPQVWHRFRELHRQEVKLSDDNSSAAVTLELDEAARQRIADAAAALGLKDDGTGR